MKDHFKASDKEIKLINVDINVAFNIYKKYIIKSN